MATNNIKPFAIGNGANVTSQADYESLSALLTGFQAGKASSAQINKALRQSSFVASMLAQFISDAAGVDVLDNGDATALLTSLIAALKANSANDFLQKTSNLTDVADKALSLANLGGAPLSSPTFTGTPKGPTAATGTSSTQFATTAFVQGAVQSASGRLLGAPIIFTSSGTYTPNPLAKFIIVEVQGAGAGGGGTTATGSGVASTTGAGGAGAYAKHSLTNPVSTPVLVGAGGSGGTAGASGTNGGASSFGAIVSCPGGTAGGSENRGTSSFGRGGSIPTGTPTGGNIYSSAGGAGAGTLGLTTIFGSPGMGASSIMGAGGIGGANTNGGNGLGSGSGGGGVFQGQNTAALAGGSGAPGVVIIWEYS